MKIRKEQMQAFPKAIETNLECRLYAHVCRALAERCRQMGESAVRRLIRDGLERTARYGIVSEYDRCRYVDLMVLVGPDFDAEPGPAEVLGDTSLRPAGKIDRLFEWAEARLRAAAGRPAVPGGAKGGGERPPAST